MSSLLRCTTANKLFDRVEATWRAQLKRLGVDPTHQWDGIFDYARRIASETPADPKYGIYALCNVNSDGSPRAPYMRLVHVNHAFPRRKGEDARFVWSYPAPTIQQETDVGLLYENIGDYISSAMGMAQQELKTKNMRIYLGAPSDNAFAKGFVAALNTAAGARGVKMTAKHVPSWLIISW